MSGEKTNNNNFNNSWEELEHIDQRELFIERLREKTFEMGPNNEIVRRDFPSGNYLYHGARNEQISGIIESGYLGNALAVWGGERIGMNSGYEGISWSMDGIDALPGTKGHIAGFLAAPERILTPETKLVVPSRPAPFEMLQVDDGIETEKFYEHRIQDEMFSDVGMLGGNNSLKDNLIRMKIWQNEQKKENPNPFVFEPMLLEFLERDWTDEELGKLYEHDENEGATKLSKDLFQQFKIPVAAVWIKRLIDGGFFENDQKYHGCSVRDIITGLKNEDDDLYRRVLSSTGMVIKHYSDALGRDLEKANAVKVPIEDMYFVTNSNDLEGWLQKFAASGHEPRGILLYDGEKVKKTNFASLERGDHAELTREIDITVNNNGDFWLGKMGVNMAEIERSGSVGQVRKEIGVERNLVCKTINGELIVIDERKEEQNARIARS